MALKATIYKAGIQIADMDRHYYADHTLTIAQHPSENDLRMMWRLVAFCLHAHEDLLFCKGVSTEDEPDLWLKEPSGEIRQWIDLGQPDEKRLRKACGRSEQVQIYAYQPRSARVWLDQEQSRWQRFSNLSVSLLSADDEDALLSLVSRTMNLQANIQDGELWLGNERATAQIQRENWKTGGQGQ